MPKILARGRPARNSDAQDMVPLPKIGPGSEFAPLQVGPGERVFVLTGAGISAESGVATFRDANGLWEQHRIEDVATPEGFARDPRLVWRFYSERRRQAAAVHPNAAHLALATLQQRIGDRLFLCTQNVDPLHERAGSTGVLHMHGELLKTRCSDCEREPFDDATAWLDAVPDCDRCGGQLRPHVVWFGEVPLGLERIYTELCECDLFVTVGSSGAVHPAAGFVSHLRHVPNSRGRFARCVYVGLERPENTHSFDECRLGKAGALLPSLFQP
ncbi:MAG TPA: NAD-dependent deacylase [Myxococcales bacterium]|jgi:NAD-dependent deacetylase|nr:NAD-dependent deacylase [Myxococcales bacterium]